MISSLIKHDHMDKAKQHLAEAAARLRSFDKELRDLDRFEDVNLETRDFLGLADVLFDGLLADTAMQSRINDARSQVDRAIQRVEEILESL